MKCVKCGKRLKNNEKFCTYCGYYNDTKNDANWNEETSDENLLEENWYDDEQEVNDEEDTVELEPVKKEKKKKRKEEKPKKEKPKKVKEEKVKEIKIKEDNIVYDQNEKYIEAYIGEDYKIIKKRPFNIWAFLLNWMYLLYRKLYITGAIGLMITTFVAFFLTKYFLIYLLVVVILLGFGFNPCYIFIVKRKVNKILEDYEGTDSFSLEKMCSEFGGVNVPIALIIYLTFLIVIVICILKPTINQTHNTKFWKENSENKANCTSMIKLVYEEEKSNYNKIEEAICKINKSNDEYEFYVKADKDGKIIYVYYKTEKEYLVYQTNTELLDRLEEKKKMQEITQEEENYMQSAKALITNYENSYNKSKEEDKLIKAKKDKTEKINFIFDHEEMIR